MDKKIILASELPLEIARRRKAMRAAFRDVAFQFRMGAGFAGDVNRTHPVDIEARPIVSTATPPLSYGIPVLLDTAAPGNVRMFGAGDSGVTKAYGIAVRPYPMQQQTVSSSTNPSPFGSVVPPIGQPLDVCRYGRIMVQLNDITQSPIAGAAVFVWCAATSGIHIQGGIETQAGGGSNTAALDARTIFMGPPDSNGIIEISFNL